MWWESVEDIRLEIPLLVSGIFLECYGKISGSYHKTLLVRATPCLEHIGVHFHSRLREQLVSCQGRHRMQDLCSSRRAPVGLQGQLALKVFNNALQALPSFSLLLKLLSQLLAIRFGLLQLQMQLFDLHHTTQPNTHSIDAKALDLLSQVALGFDGLKKAAFLCHPHKLQFL
ncbi:hypothetical protein EYF80_005878 [Liparis tanakae]|uniref:Uncharacterized protein n=1 Tax=Liparis tanakae TaxID=230148 RepID=A0A4Z2J1V8_9TELE|nr:hypothetical protein EYF80_005878 [Liparis tanakae]